MASNLLRTIQHALRHRELGNAPPDQHDRFAVARDEARREYEDLEHERNLQRSTRERRLKRNWGL